MMRPLFLKLLVCVVFLGCTKGKPEFENLDSDAIPRPTFSGTFTKNIITANTTSPISIRGECDSRITSLNLTLKTGFRATTNSAEALASSATINCALNGTFSFELKKLTDLIETTSETPSENSVYEIDVRGTTTAGLSRPSFVRITYSKTVGGPRPTQITIGGTPLASGPNGFSAKLRMTHSGLDPIITPTSAQGFFNKTDGLPNGFSAHIGLRATH